MKTLVQRIVDQSSAVAAGLGVVLSPIPFADEALLLPVLGAMTLRIGRVYGLGWKEVPWKAIAKTAVGGLAARATVNLGVAYIPFVAAAANAASAATLTGAFGAYADRACHDPSHAHSETLDELKVDVRELATRWRRLCSRSNEDVARDSVHDVARDSVHDVARDSVHDVARDSVHDVARDSTRDTRGGSSMSENEAVPTNCNPSAQAVAPVVQELRSDIEHTLHTRHFGHGEVLFAVEDGAKSAGAKLWERLKHRPYAGVAAASALGFTLASMTGVGELAVAVLCGYGAYEILRRGRPVNETVEEMVKDVGKMA
jgi:uncharacterized protein (DUF697 family)